MTIWIVALVCILGCGALGRPLGAIRCIFLTLGVIVATLVSLPLGRLIEPVMAITAIKTTTGLMIASPLLVYFFVFVGFSLMGHGLYRKVEIYYKYQTTDEKCALWQRMHIQTGFCLGLLLGMTILISFGTMVYGVGYMTRQVVPKEGPNFFIGFINKFHDEMRKTNFERLPAAIDPFPEKWYDLADVLGLVYNNPELRTRLVNYPVFLNYHEMPEFQSIATGAVLNSTITNKTKVQAFFNNTNHVAFAKLPNVKPQLKELDLKDLRKYLETGESEKFATEKIVGKWGIELSATIPQISKSVNDLRVVAQIRRYLIVLAPDLTMTATPDGQLYLKGSKVEFNQLVDLLNARAPRQATGDPAQQNAYKIIAKGSWTKEGDQFKVTFPDSNVTGMAQMHTDRVIMINFDKGALAFARFEE